jgi:hypothetical protein
MNKEENSSNLEEIRRKDSVGTVSILVYDVTNEKNTSTECLENYKNYYQILARRIEESEKQ